MIKNSRFYEQHLKVKIVYRKDGAKSPKHLVIYIPNGL